MLILVSECNVRNVESPMTKTLVIIKKLVIITVTILQQPSTSDSKNYSNNDKDDNTVK